MSRAAIFAKIESATSALKTKQAYPDYDMSLVYSLPKLQGEDLWEIFVRNFAYVNGKAMTSIDELIDFLKKSLQFHGYCDPALFDTIGSKLVAAGLTIANAMTTISSESPVPAVRLPSPARSSSMTTALPADLPRFLPGYTSRCWSARTSIAPSRMPSPLLVRARTSSGAQGRRRPPMSRASSSKVCTVRESRSPCFCDGDHGSPRFVP
jgi:hypothetical protein